MIFPAPAIVLSLFAAFAATSPLPDASGPDPSKVYIEGVSYAGSGCKAGSVAITGNDAWTIVTLAFDSYIASVGPGVPFVDRRKNCNINFKLRYPQGYSYTIYKSDYVGRVELGKNVRAYQESKYWFSGFPPQPPYPSSNWIGPKAEDYQFSDTVDQHALVWAPCGVSTTLNVNTQIRVDNDLNQTASGFITTDVIDQRVDTQFAIRWKQCP